MPQKPAETDFPVLDAIRERWSPRSFSDRRVTDEALGSLLEAARWAPSAFNGQPWAFLVARREDEEAHRRMLACLRPSNQRWAGGAAVLALTFAKGHFEQNGQPNRHAFHDVGLAIGFLAVQATALGISLHQMAGIERERIREEFGIPAEYEPVTALAIGYAGDPEELPEDLRQRELAPRRRKPLAEIAFAGRWGSALHLGAPEPPSA